MKKYEIMYILNATLDEAAAKGEIAKLQKILEDNKAKVLDTKEWGIKDFASIIKKQMSSIVWPSSTKTYSAT